MKYARILTIGLSFFCFSTLVLSAQVANDKTDKKEIKVQKNTLMERFEPDLVVSVEDRIQLKKDRLLEIRQTRKILDTLDISDRKRQKLLKDLRLSPFSTRLSKVMAETKFEEDGQ